MDEAASNMSFVGFLDFGIETLLAAAAHDPAQYTRPFDEVANIRDDLMAETGFGYPSRPSALPLLPKYDDTFLFPNQSSSPIVSPSGMSSSSAPRPMSFNSQTFVFQASSQQQPADGHPILLPGASGTSPSNSGFDTDLDFSSSQATTPAQSQPHADSFPKSKKRKAAPTVNKPKAGAKDLKTKNSKKKKSGPMAREGLVLGLGSGASDTSSVGGTKKKRNQKPSVDVPEGDLSRLPSSIVNEIKASIKRVKTPLPSGTNPLIPVDCRNSDELTMIFESTTKDTNRKLAEFLEERGFAPSTIGWVKSVRYTKLNTLNQSHKRGQKAGRAK